MFRARGCTPEEAADLAQEAAIRAFVHIRRWGVTNGGLDPLLNRIARNLLIDRYRRVTPHLVPLDSAGDLHDPEQDPTEEFARRQRGRDVHRAIRSLPSRHQAAITYSLSGMSPEEVGRQMGIGRNAADALLHRARRSLKEHLEPVREGMWGIALAFRVRFDRVMRRTGAEGGVAETSTHLIPNLAAGLATAAIVVVASVGGGGAGGSGSSFPSPLGGGAFSKAAAAERGASATAGVPPSSMEGIGGGGSIGDGSGGSGDSFRLGPTTTSSDGHGGYSNDVVVPDPADKNGPPLVEIQQDLWRRGQPSPHDDGQQDLFSKSICGLGDPVCKLKGSRRA